MYHCARLNHLQGGRLLACQDYGIEHVHIFGIHQSIPENTAEAVVAFLLNVIDSSSWKRVTSIPRCCGWLTVAVHKDGEDPSCMVAELVVAFYVFPDHGDCGSWRTY